MENNGNAKWQIGRDLVFHFPFVICHFCQNLYPSLIASSGLKLLVARELQQKLAFDTRTSCVLMHGGVGRNNRIG
jgi:hypothetical protein